MSEPFRRTRSVCPICLEPAAAQLHRDDKTGAVFLQKACPAHGAFTVPVWRGRFDFEKWTAGAQRLGPGEGLRCPSSCGICAEHGRGTCCALLEVTKRCNLYCRYCFAHGGETDGEPSLQQLKQAVDDILRQCGTPLLQLSGGEPSLRDDLPELVAYAREHGCPAVQLNTNGLRLAEEPEYVHRLAQAGLTIVFLQFDGVTDEVYRTLRGRDLLETKLRAIENCGREQIGVTLVPTVVRGVNDGMLGDIIRLGASLSPAVRGVHFQPVAHFGRYPATPQDDMRYTLDELMDDICRQTGLSADIFQPSCCDHPLCGFHVSALANPCCGDTQPAQTDSCCCGDVQPTQTDSCCCGDAPPPQGDSCCCGDTPPTQTESCCCGDTPPAQVDSCCGITPLPPAAPAPRKQQPPADENRNYVIRHWRRSLSPEEEAPPSLDASDVKDLDTFLRLLKTRSFTLTAMAFQDAWNLDIERLHSCSLHVYSEGKVKPFCANYLTAAQTES